MRFLLLVFFMLLPWLPARAELAFSNNVLRQTTSDGKSLNAVARGDYKILADDVLTAIKGPAKSFQLFDVSGQEGIALALPIKLSSLPVPDKFRIMLEGIEPSALKQKSVTLTFVYEKGGEKSVAFPIKESFQALQDAEQKKLQEEQKARLAEEAKAGTTAKPPSPAAVVPKAEGLKAETPKVDSSAQVQE